MTNAEERICQRLSLFHSELERLVKVADQNWLEGGMYWRADFKKRGAKPFEPRPDLQENFDQLVHQWSILLWYVHGCPHHDQMRDGDISISMDDVNAFSLEAARLLTDIRPQNGNEKSYLFIEVSEGDHVKFEFLFVTGKHALSHTGMWSVD